MPKKIFSSDFIALADLYLAYKKAKSEAFFDNLHPCIIALSAFEQNLRGNLEKLHGVLTKGEFDWWEDQDFIGEYLYIPKSIDDSEWDDIERTHFRSVDPIDDWRLRYEESGEKRLKSEFRLIISASAEYQIISALWILKVGHLFEGRLDKNHSYGNRLRRRQSPIVWGKNSNEDINEESIGLFNPYFSAYRSWRQNGLDAMRRLVDDGKSVTAITMDLV